MTQQRRFTKEFEDEAVRLVQTSGRSQREIAEDLGIGLSTLVRGSAGAGNGRSMRRPLGAEGRRGRTEAAAAGERDPSPSARADPPCRLQQPILLRRLPGGTPKARHPDLDVEQRKLLRL